MSASARQTSTKAIDRCAVINELHQIQVDKLSHSTSRSFY